MDDYAIHLQTLTDEGLKDLLGRQAMKLQNLEAQARLAKQVLDKISHECVRRAVEEHRADKPEKQQCR